MVLRHRLGLLIASAALCAACAPTPPPAPVRPTAPPIPTATAACQYARQIGVRMTEIEEIVSLGEGAGDTTIATHIRNYVAKHQAQVDAVPPSAGSKVHVRAKAVFRAANDLALAWYRFETGRPERAAFDAALADTRAAIATTCAP